MTPDRLRLYTETEGAPMVDTRTFKQRFLAGDKEAVMYCDPNEPKTTSYTSTMRGLQVREDERAAILNDCRISFVG